MAIRKPSVSVEEAKRLAKLKPDADIGQDSPSSQSTALRQDTASLAAEPSVPSPQASSATEISPPGPRHGLQPLRAHKLSEELSAPIAAPRQAVATTPDSLFANPVFPEAEPEEPKTQVFLSAPLPARGVSASYDVLSQQYSPTKALQMILRRALDDYEARLDDGSYRASAAEYAIGNKDKPPIIQTSRMMSVRLIGIARAHFDPLGFESTRAFGRKLACAALAQFFAMEEKRK